MDFIPPHYSLDPALLIVSSSTESGYAQNPLHTFPRNFPVDGEVSNLLRTCCGLVSDTANKSATSRCNGIWGTTRQSTQ